MPLLDPDLLVPNPWKGTSKLLGALSGLDSLNRFADRAGPENTGHDWVQQILGLLDVQCEVSPRDLGSIPRTGPVIMAANHPFGILDGLISLSVAATARRDIKMLANALLEPVQPLREHLILVDVPPSCSQRNVRAMADAAAWLRSGGMLITFPAGEVSSWDWRNHAVLDAAWHPAVARLAARTNSTILPAWFSGSNSIPFQLLGMLHPSLRTLRLPAEFTNKRGARIELRIGRPVSQGELCRFTTPEEQVNHLRNRTLLLRYRQPVPRKAGLAPLPVHSGSGSLMQAEIDRSQSGQLLDQCGPLEVYQARAHQIPAVMHEIGILREAAFRLAGVGTGRKSDPAMTRRLMGAGTWESFVRFHSLVTDQR